MDALLDHETQLCVNAGVPPWGGAHRRLWGMGPRMMWPSLRQRYPVADRVSSLGGRKGSCLSCGEAALSPFHPRGHVASDVGIRGPRTRPHMADVRMHFRDSG